MLQLYTSGTTGLPKGVMLTNDNFFAGIDEVADSWRLTPDSVNLAVMPMFHIAGSGWALVGLGAGLSTVLIRDVDPARILARDPRVRRDQRVLGPGGHPVAAVDARGADHRLLDLRAIVYGASPITETVLTQGDGRRSAASSSRCTG